MKEYKLSGWPDLQAPYHRTRFRRMLSDMSHRYVTLAQLATRSNTPRQEVRLFLEMLADRGVLDERTSESESMLDSLSGLSGWFRRTVTGDLPKN
jgi:hypothetical protein